MKRYLARLAVRARPPVVSAAPPASSVEDPFSATADFSATPQDLSSVRTGEQSPPLRQYLRPSETQTKSMTSAPASDSSSMLQPSRDAARLSAAAAASGDRSDPDSTSRSRDRQSSADQEAKQSAAPATELSSFIKPGMLEPDRSARRDSGTDQDLPSSREERPSLKPETEADLLKLADRFMQGLQTTRSASTEMDESPDAIAPLLPSHDDASSARHRDVGQNVQPSPTVHIGSLRVEIVEPPSVTPAAAPRTRVVVRPSGGASGPRGTTRSAFGLRQL